MQRNNFRFEQLNVGDAVENYIDVTPELLSAFIEISGDNSQIHQDKTYAKAAGFNDAVVHGTLILSFYSALIGSKLPGDSALLLELSCKFHRPAYVNDKILVTATISEKHESVNCISIKLKAYNSNAEKLSSGQAVVKIRS